MKYKLNISVWVLLAIVLAILKLCGVLHWSWWLVISPLSMCALFQVKPFYLETLK